MPKLSRQEWLLEFVHRKERVFGDKSADIMISAEGACCPKAGTAKINKKNFLSAVRSEHVIMKRWIIK